jgi:signal transduction histidine kinase
MFSGVLIVIKFVDIMGIPFSPYTGRQGQEREEAFKGLSLIADLKKERLLRWMEEGRYDTRLFSTNGLVEENVSRLRTVTKKLEAEGKKDIELWSLVRKEEGYRALIKFLNNVKTTYKSFDRIQIADAETGTIFASTDEGDLGADVSHQSNFTGALWSRDKYIGDIELTREDHRPVLYISHVIREREGEVVAIWMMEVDAEDIIKPMLHTGEGLGERDEALLFNHDGLILTSLKHPLADGTKAKPLEYLIRAKPAVLAARGEEGIIESKDYRGEPVLAAYRHIRISSELGWGMVVKRDKAELFAPLRQDVAFSFLVGLTSILAVVILTILSAKSLTRPILSLSETADNIAKGDLSARAEVSSSDEVGNLAVMFNSMIQRIQDWQGELEEQVRARSKELNKTNEELKREIAERERVQEEREALIEELEGKNEELEQFTYTVSHDLKSPLITIKGFLGLIEKDSAKGNTDELKENMARISNAAEKMERLLEELLELSRIGRLSNSPEEGPFENLVREALDLVAGRLRESNVRVEIKNDLPLIYGDLPRLREVMENLIDNAVKFMKDQGDPVIEIGANVDNNETIFYVRDNGIGINPKYHQKIFDLFDKLDQNSEGTGVGLTIVKRIVEVHGGRIWVDSNGLGKGATFCFTIPARAEAMTKEG